MRRSPSLAAALAAVAIPFLLPSVAGAAITLGPGAQPGLAVDAAGTAYVAWSGLGNPQSLMFCRVPRVATACDPARRPQSPPPAPRSDGRSSW